MVVKEGSNVTFRCEATGSPLPTITWRRESGDPISVAPGSDGNGRVDLSMGILLMHLFFSWANTATSFNGSIFSIARVDRLNMGAYLCIASNGIPPTVSKRIMLIVHCKCILLLFLLIMNFKWTQLSKIQTKFATDRICLLTMFPSKS